MGYAPKRFPNQKINWDGHGVMPYGHNMTRPK